MSLALRSEETKSSDFSLKSTATAITVKRNIEKKKVVRNFLSMYQSIFFMSNNPPQARIIRFSKVKENLLQCCYKRRLIMSAADDFQEAKLPSAICFLASAT